jgi:alkaline phosphatase D
MTYMNKSFLIAIALLLSHLAIAQPFLPQGSTKNNNTPAVERPLTFNVGLEPFYHGVASGDPSTSSVIIWTRVTPEQTGTIPVSYRVATDVAFRNVVASGNTTAEAAKDYTVKVEVTGLQPGRTYYYYFTALNRNSIVGRAKTCPAGPVSQLRFAVMSCSNYEAGLFNAYATIAERNDLDAVIHLGDYIYEYGTGVYPVNLPVANRKNEPTTEILNLTDYRTRYSLYRLDQDMIRLHQQHTIINIWDDHESANDSYKDGAENHQPNEGPWETRKNISKQVYFEWMPIRDNQSRDIYRKFTYGDLCDLLMIDTRLEGRVEPPTNFDTPDVPARTMISPTQFGWLTENLKTSRARWKVIGNQVLFSTMNVGFAAGNRATNIDSVRAVENVFIDNWESYPTQRNSIIDTLQRRNINNTIILTGDSHASWAFDVTKLPVLYPVAAFQNIPQPNPFNPATGAGYNKTTGQGSYAVEFATPSISSPNFDEALGAATTAQFEFVINNPIPPNNFEYNPHLKYVDLDRHGYFLLDLKPDTAQANFYYVPTLTQRNLTESFGRGAFTVNGQNRIQVRNTPSTGKPVQDVPTPLLPFGTSSVKAADNPVALFSVYPNPAVDQVYLQFGLNATTDLTINVYDLSGKLVLSQPATNYRQGLYQYALDISALAKGTYVVSVEGKAGVLARHKLAVNR